MNSRSLSFEEVLAEERRAIGVEAGEGDAPAALCISGGGIRSATFALGVVQGLAAHGLLEHFHYLSTVSGGGYLGGLLSAWAHRAGGIAEVAGRLRPDAPAPGPGQADPIAHLREYNNYLSPRRGALSSDTWTLVATVLRNVLLNWLVLLPVLMLAAMLPRLYLAALAFPEQLYRSVLFAGGAPDYAAPRLDAISDSIWVRQGLPLASAVLFAWALFNVLRYLPGVGGRDHGRNEFLRNVLAPLTGSVLTFLAFDSLFFLGGNYTDYSHLAPDVLWTVVPAASAWVAFLVFHRRPLRERFRLLFGPLSLSIPFMAAGTGAAAWITTNYLLWSPDPTASLTWAEYVTIGPPLILLGFFLGAVLFGGLSSRFLGDRDREWMARAVGNVLIAAVGWFVLAGLVLVVPRWALHREWLDGVLAVVGSASAAASALGGWLSSGDGSGHKGGGLGRWLVAKLAPLLFVASLVAGLAILTDVLLLAAGRLPGLSGIASLQVLDARGAPLGWREHYEILHFSNPLLLLAMIVALALLAWGAARFIDTNTFSLHGMYRDRLVRAYLGASNPDRSAHRFTGFAAGDDLAMSDLAAQPVARPGAEEDRPSQPFHVVNLTLNLVAPGRLAWQQRKARSFTVTPLAAGSRGLGYRESASYGGGITLGTAVAISGAAASPSMGYNSSPLVSFIMTLFNARLGAWLGNPGPAGEHTWREAGPRSAVRSLVKEALGLTSDRSEYVYLSDGGHFENLALYEMVARRCRFVLVLDGGCDPAFAYDDLGGALRKIRIDLGVSIVFEDRFRRPLRERTRRCAVASIRYSDVDPEAPDGTLVYVKPMLLGTEPPDVASYAAAHPDFPHQGTGDQWFDESQTESYRMLGLATVEEICRGFEGGGFAGLRHHLETVYLGGEGRSTPPSPSSSR